MFADRSFCTILFNYLMGVSKQHRSITCLQVIRLRQTLAAQEEPNKES